MSFCFDSLVGIYPLWLFIYQHKQKILILPFPFLYHFTLYLPAAFIFLGVHLVNIPFYNCSLVKVTRFKLFCDSADNTSGLVRRPDFILIIFLFWVCITFRKNFVEDLPPCKSKITANILLNSCTLTTIGISCTFKKQNFKYLSA